MPGFIVSRTDSDASGVLDARFPRFQPPILAGSRSSKRSPAHRGPTSLALRRSGSGECELSPGAGVDDDVWVGTDLPRTLDPVARAIDEVNTLLSTRRVDAVGVARWLARIESLNPRELVRFDQQARAYYSGVRWSAVQEPTRWRRPSAAATAAWSVLAMSSLMVISESARSGPPRCVRWWSDWWFCAALTGSPRCAPRRWNGSTRSSQLSCCRHSLWPSSSRPSAVAARF
jgi:hypothetical protein